MTRLITLLTAISIGAVAVFMAVVPQSSVPGTPDSPSPGEPAWTHVCLGMVSDPEWCQ